MPYKSKCSNDGSLYICAMHEPLKVSKQDLIENSIRQTAEDYDTEFHIVEKIYYESKNTGVDFYELMELYVQQTRDN